MYLARNSQMGPVTVPVMYHGTSPNQFNFNYVSGASNGYFPALYKSLENLEYPVYTNSPSPISSLDVLTNFPQTLNSRNFSIKAILQSSKNESVRQYSCQGNRDAQVYSALNSYDTPVLNTFSQPIPRLEMPKTVIERVNSEPLPDSRYTEFQFNPLMTDSRFQTRKFPHNLEIRIRRPRTTFTPHQMEVLEAEFSKTQYMAGQNRVLLARMLNLKESQVKIWFQNRRIKYRKRFLANQKEMLKKQKDETKQKQKDESKQKQHKN